MCSLKKTPKTNHKEYFLIYKNEMQWDEEKLP